MTHLTDQTVSARDLYSIGSSLSDAGVESIGKAVGIPVKIMALLKKKELLDVVFKEIDQKQNAEYKIRYYDNIPIGCPTGPSASEVTEYLNKANIDMSSISPPYVLYSEKTYSDVDVEILKNDIYKIGEGLHISLLNANVDLTAELLRVICTNMITEVDHNFSRHYKLSSFCNKESKKFISSEAKNELIAMYRKEHNDMKNTKVNLFNIYQFDSLANQIGSQTLIDNVSQMEEDIFSEYEMPQNFRYIEKPSQLRALPSSWKKTAQLPTSIYEVWNDFTSNLSRMEEQKDITTENAFKLHIKVARNFKLPRMEEILVAAKRNVN